VEGIARRGFRVLEERGVGSSIDSLLGSDEHANYLGNLSKTDDTACFEVQYGTVFHSDLHQTFTQKKVVTNFDYISGNMSDGLLTHFMRKTRESEPQQNKELIRREYLRLMQSIHNLNANQVPTDNVKAVLKDVLATILTRFKGKLGTDTSKRVRDAILLMPEMIDVLTRFGTASREALKEVFEEYGKNKQVLVKLYIQSYANQLNSQKATDSVVDVQTPSYGRKRTESRLVVNLEDPSSPKGQLRGSLDGIAADIHRGDYSDPSTRFIAIRDQVALLVQPKPAGLPEPFTKADRFSHDDSRMLLGVLQTHQMMGFSNTTAGHAARDLANRIINLREMAPDEVIDSVLKGVLISIVFRVQGHTVKDGDVGIKETLFSDTLRDVLTKFGAKSCDIILDVLCDYGKNRDLLTALYVEARIKCLEASASDALLSDIKDAISGLSASVSGANDLRPLFQQLDAAIEPFSDQLSSLAPYQLNNLISSMAMAFCNRFESQLDPLIRGYKGLNKAETQFVLSLHDGPVDTVMPYLRSARMSEDIDYGYAHSMGRQTDCLNHVFATIMPLNNGDANVRDALLYRFRDELVAFGEPCCRAVCKALGETGKNRRLFVAMYIASRIQAPKVQVAFNAKIEERNTRQEQERATLAKAREDAHLAKKRAEDQRRSSESKDGIPEVAVKTAVVLPVSRLRTSTLEQETKAEQPTDPIAVLRPYKTDSELEIIKDSLGASFKDEYVAGCFESKQDNSPQEQINLDTDNLNRILNRLVDLHQTQLNIFQTPNGRFASLNAFLTSCGLEPDKRNRALVKRATLELVGLRATREDALKNAVRLAITDWMVGNGPTITRSMSMGEAMDALGHHQSLQGNENADTFHFDFLFRDHHTKRLKSEKVNFTYGELNGDKLSRTQWKAQKMSNAVLVGFILKSLDLPINEYNKTIVNGEMLAMFNASRETKR